MAMQFVNVLAVALCTVLSCCYDQIVKERAGQSCTLFQGKVAIPAGFQERKWAFLTPKWQEALVGCKLDGAHVA